MMLWLIVAGYLLVGYLSVMIFSWLDNRGEEVPEQMDGATIGLMVTLWPVVGLLVLAYGVYWVGSTIVEKIPDSVKTVVNPSAAGVAVAKATAPKKPYVIVEGNGEND